MKALITGISGQDGSYLAEHLIERGDEVFGIVRRHSVSENQDSRLIHLFGKYNTFYGDLTDHVSLMNVMEDVRPDYIFNLAAQSHVLISSKIPSFSIDTNFGGVISLLDIMRRIVPTSKFYQASSSEMFGNCCDVDGTQNLDTPMHPVSPYAISKLAAYHAVRHYRNAYGLFAVNGILFNHTSERRTSNFVVAKIVKTAIMIKYGLAKKLVMGNLDAWRDFGHAKDYTKAMIKLLDYHIPREWIVATGVSVRIRDICEHVFDLLGMDYKEYVVENDPTYIRPQELVVLRGDPTETMQLLDWEPEYTFDDILVELIAYWEDKIVEKFGLIGDVK